jgi:molybdate transport repressor ModE-like protein
LVTVKPAFKIWLETDRGYVFGEGPFNLLTGIRETGTLSGAAKALGMSYRHAWGLVKEVEQNIGKAMLITHKGGKAGGGGAELTKEALNLLTKYERAKTAFTDVHTQLHTEFFNLGSGSRRQRAKLRSTSS